jgi:hypothetical protein
MKKILILILVLFSMSANARGGGHGGGGHASAGHASEAVAHPAAHVVEPMDSVRPATTVNPMMAHGSSSSCTDEKRKRKEC